MKISFAFSIISAFLLLIPISCYKEDRYNSSRLPNILRLVVEKENQPADGVSTGRVLAEFPIDFSTEDDNNVEFIITGSTSEIKKTAAIRFVDNNGEPKRVAEISLSTNNVEVLKIKAVISINQFEIAREIELPFKRALCDSLNLASSSLVIVPDSSFSEITLTTRLIRNIGMVSIGTAVATRVVDSNGIARGRLVNYQSKTDSTGKVLNKFTMGNDPYLGALFVISESTDATSSIKGDTLIIYAQK